MGDDQNAYGIDFIELEEALPEIQRPADAVSIADYQGAQPGDGLDDSDALIWAMNEAANTSSKTVYIPAGTWELGRKIGLDHSDLTIQGAGMWYTNLRFTSDQAGGGGFASWSSIDTSTNSQARVAEANSFVGNTIELGWRASGIGIFGGKSHAIRDNLLINNFSGAGIRLNTVFDGHNFDLNTDGGITIAHNKLVRSGTTNDFYGNTRGAIDFREVKGGIRNVSATDNVIVRPYAEEIRADFGLGESALSSRGITLRDNKRDDEVGYTAKSQVVNYAQVNGSVVRGIPETDDFSLYWFQGEEGGPDGTTHRYWISKADGVELTGDMEYSQEGNTRVYNVATGDVPQYLPASSTDFSGSYTYVGDLARSQPADDGMRIVIRSGPRSDLTPFSLSQSPALPR